MYFIIVTNPVSSLYMQIFYQCSRPPFNLDTLSPEPGERLKEEMGWRLNKQINKEPKMLTRTNVQLNAFWDNRNFP